LASPKNGKLVGGTAINAVLAAPIQGRGERGNPLVEDSLAFPIQRVPVKNPVIQGQAAADVGGRDRIDDHQG
jgi:hypothetical protein